MSQEIKEKLRKILNSEITKTFLDNTTKPLGDKTKRCIIINRQDSVNSFLDNVFLNINDDDVFVEDLHNNSKINNLIFNGKRINVKTLSYKNNSIFFNNFPFREGNDFNVKFHLEKTMDKLKYFDYFLFIIIFRNERDEKHKVGYEFYLKPATSFYFDTENFYKTLNGFRGENWEIKSNKEFFFLINKYNLGKLIYFYDC